jgi:hypothetical protein
MQSYGMVSKIDIKRTYVLKKIGLHACSKYEPVVMEGEGTI